MPICPAGHDSTDPDFCDTCGMRIGGPPPKVPDVPSGPVGAPGPGPATIPGTPSAGKPCPQCGTARSGQFCEGCGYDFAAGKPTRPPAPPSGPSGGVPGAGDAGTGPGAGDLGTGPGAGTGPDAGTAPGAGSGPDGGGPDTGTPVVGGPGSGPAVGGPAADGAQAAVWTAVVTADRGYYDTVMAEGGPDSTSIEFPGYCPERRFRLSGAEMRIGRRSVSRGLEPEIDLTGPPTDPGVSHMHAVLVSQVGGWAVLDPGSANGTVVNGHEIAPGVRVPLRDGDKVCVGAWTMLTIRTATS